MITLCARVGMTRRAMAVPSVKSHVGKAPMAAKHPVIGNGNVVTAGVQLR